MKRITGFGFLALSICWTSASFAQTRSRDNVFWETENWEVIGLANAEFCILKHTFADPVSLTIAKGGAQPGLLRYRNFENTTPFTSATNIAFNFDDQVFPASVFGGRTYVPDSDDGQVQLAFQTANVMTIVHNGGVVAEVSLAGSARAFSKLEECAAQWPDSVVPTIPPPPPITIRAYTPEPDLDGPFEPNQVATPLAPSNWIKPSDYPAITPGQPAEGRTGVSIDINSLGRITDCSIMDSSGSPELDTATCQVLTANARFQPATDENGQPIAANIPFVITWAKPR